MYLFLLPCLWEAAQLAPSRTSDSLDRLAVAVVESQMRINRLWCDAYMFNTENGQPAQTLRVVHGVDQNRRYVEIIHDASPSILPWHDPFRNQTWTDKRKSVMFRLFERNAYCWKSSERDFDNLLYGDCLGWRQPGEVALRYVLNGRRFALMDVFAVDQRPILRLLPEPEVWNGLACRVVVADGGRDRLWICPDRGYALVHRIWQPSDKKGMVAEFTCSDFEQVTPGMWLPKTCGCEFRPLGEEGEPHSYRLEVEHVAVNDKVPDSLFEPQFLPGSHIFGTSGTLERSIPGGTDLLDLWVAVLLSDYPPIRPTYAGLSEANLFWITMGSVLFVAGIVLRLRTSAAEGGSIKPGAAPR
jgi:hypothetical protein